MTEDDFLDYEPSRVRFEDVLEQLDRWHAPATRALPFMPSLQQMEDMVARDTHAQWVAAGRPKAKPRHRTIASARSRLQQGEGIGMVMLCALGQMHDAEHQTTWQSEPGHGRRSGMSSALWSDSGE